MTWIDIIEYQDSTGRLRKLYDQCKNPDGSIDRVLKIHSLRPRTLHAHLFLYKAVLHTEPNELSYRERELVGMYVSYLNDCEYCFKHHTAGLGRELDDMELAEQLAYDCTVPEPDRTVVSDREQVMMRYAKKLTLHPQHLTKQDIEVLRVSDLSDTAILDLNQIISYFNYVNRLVNGLGVDIAGETLGFHPDRDTNGFHHQ